MAVSIVSEKYECDGRVRNPKPNTVKGMTVIPYISETRDTMVVSVNQSLIPLRAWLSFHTFQKLETRRSCP